LVGKITGKPHDLNGKIEGFPVKIFPKKPKPLRFGAAKISGKNGGILAFWDVRNDLVGGLKSHPSEK